MLHITPLHTSYVQAYITVDIMKNKLFRYPSKCML